MTDQNAVVEDAVVTTDNQIAKIEGQIAKRDAKIEDVTKRIERQTAHIAAVTNRRAYFESLLEKWKSQNENASARLENLKKEDVSGDQS